MKQKIFALLIASALLTLAACAPTSTEKDDATKHPEPPNALETSPSDSPEIQPAPVETAQLIRFDSQLGCSATYDPAFFTARDHEDEYWKRITGFYVESTWENDGFHLWVGVIPLDTSSVEEAVSDESLRTLDKTHGVGPRGEVIRKDVTFGTGDYPAVRLTYNEVYAVGEIYVTEQNGTVYEVEISSYYQPSKELLTQAYAILDSITF